MRGAARTITTFFRLAFWPLAASSLVVLLLQPVFYLSLASLGALPQDRIAQHIAVAFEQGVLADDGNPRGPIWKGGEQLTECISFGAGDNHADSSWRNAITGAYPMIDDTHACTGLHRAVAGEPTAWKPYFRYWHGYRVILAPLAAAFSIWCVKLINALMIAAAGALFWRALRASGGDAVATVVLIAFVGLSDILFIWRTSTHTLSLAYILIGSALFAAAVRKHWTPAALILLAAVFGSGFNFIDFLINPPMMPMLLAFFVVLSERRGAGLLAVSVVVAWFGGYAETWVAKWVIAYLAMPDPAAVVADIVGTIEIRAVGTLNGIVLVPLAATVRVFLRAMNRVGVIIPLVALVAIVRYAATVSRIAWKRALWFASPTLVCVVWFEALSSHTQFHLTPSSRSAAMAIALILAALVIAMPQRPTLSDLAAQLRGLWARLLLARRAA